MPRGDVAMLDAVLSTEKPDFADDAPDATAVPTKAGWGACRSCDCKGFKLKPGSHMCAACGHHARSIRLSCDYLDRVI